MSKGVKIGFDFVPFPQEIWRDSIDLSESEFKLLGYLLYRQVRFGRGIISLTDNDCLKGKLSPNGNRLDAGCGVKGHNNLKRAKESLVARGWITYETGKGYKILLTEPDDDMSETDMAMSDSDMGGCPKQTTLMSESDMGNKESKNLERIEYKPCQRTKKPSTDTRYQSFVEALNKYWNFKNPNEPFEFSELDGKALKLFLQHHPKMTIEQFRLCLNNRSKSEAVSHTEDIYRWLGNAKQYLAGALDRFGKLLGTHSNGKPTGTDEYGGHFEGDVYVTRDGKRMPGYVPPPTKARAASNVH
jgi:hypothetical protein